MHIAEAYAERGYHIIPIETGGKRPSTLLPGRTWGQYQDTAPSPEEIQGWIKNGTLNWGLACKRGECCGDCDDLEAAAWILADPTRPLFRGACIVRSGHGKAHIWFKYTGDLRTTVWRMDANRKMGDVRTYGSYVLVPPSRLADGGVYERMAGSMETLPTVDDPEQFLAAIVNAYKTECQVRDTPPPDRSSKRILVLSEEESNDIRSRVDRADFKKKILDTLFVKGHQTPGSLHWRNLSADSHSEIDFAVCCEFYRKGWVFDDVERVFACTLVGEACYANAARDHHGHSYLLTTWDNARKAVDADRVAQRLPQGDGHRVAQVSAVKRGEDHLYTLVLEEPDGHRWGPFKVTSSELGSESKFQDACFAQTGFVPRFHANQKGREFKLFTQAVHNMIPAEEITRPPEELTRMGVLQGQIRRHLTGPSVLHRQPESYAEARGTGWREGAECLVRLGALVERVEMLNHFRLDPDDIRQALLEMTEDVHPVIWQWPDHDPERLTYLRLRPVS